MITTRENRKLAIKWAKDTVKKNSSMIISDQFWTAFDDMTQICAAKRKLKALNIMVFDFDGRGAVLVHKDNPKLKVSTFNGKDGKNYISGSYTNIVDGKNYSTILYGEAV
jgi:hypothetical protein